MHWDRFPHKWRLENLERRCSDGALSCIPLLATTVLSKILYARLRELTSLPFVIKPGLGVPQSLNRPLSQ